MLFWSPFEKDNFGKYNLRIFFKYAPIVPTRNNVMELS